MIDTELRAQMLTFTADDTPPPDLLRRVQVGVRRTQARRRAVVGGVAAAVTVAGLSVTAGALGGAPERSGLAQQEPAPQGELGPSDAELRAADWFSYESQPEQPGTERELERRWMHRDGRHVLGYGDGPAEVISTDSVFPFGARGVSFDELLALPADPAELDRRMREADGGRPDAERVLDQVRQLLGRSPALSPVRRALVDAALRHDAVTLTDGEQDSRGRPALLLEHTDRDGAVQRLWIDPQGYRLLEERTVVGPNFPTPPTDAPVPPDAAQQTAPSHADGDLLYAEVFLSWGTGPPPTG
jgi:hypothetical protein